MTIAIKVKIGDIADGDAQKIYSAIGRAGEEISERSYYQHTGFTSIPKAGNVGIVLIEGDNLSMIATTDEKTDRPALSDEGDVAIYADEEKYIKISEGGEIEASNGKGKIIMRENGDIELGDSSLKQLITEDIITAMNAHTHAGVTVGGGVTAVPVYAPPLSTFLHATQKTKAE